MKRLYTLILLLACSPSLAQWAPHIQWQKSYGGSGSDVANAISQTKDGGYIVAGTSSSNNLDVSGNHGNGDYWIVKLNVIGGIQWQKSYGGSGYEITGDIQQTADRGYIIVGSSKSNDGDVTVNHGLFDYWIVKVDSVGTIEWQKSLGGMYDEYAYAIKQTSDGGYIIAGSSTSSDGDITNHHGQYPYEDCWVVKLTAVGNLQWQKTYGGSNADEANSIVQTTDGGFIIAGYASSTDGDVSSNHGVTDAWVLKIDDTGAIQWQKTYGGSVGDDAQSISLCKDGGYVITASSASSNGDLSNNHGYADYWVFKINTAGNVEWQKSFGGGGADIPYSIQQTSDTGYIIAGFTKSGNNGDISGFRGGADDYWIVKLDKSGSLLWQKALGGGYYDEAYAIQQTTDGGYIVAGYTSSNNGDVTNYYGNGDMWIVKLNSGIGVGEVEKKLCLMIYPNPSHDFIILKSNESLIGSNYVLNDMWGRVLLTSKITDIDMQIPLNSLPAGNYILHVSGFSPIKLTKY